MLQRRPNIGITGGSGFPAPDLGERWLKQRNHFICMDNFCAGTHDDLASAIGSPRFGLIEHGGTSPHHAHFEEIVGTGAETRIAAA